ncbi:MAG: DUF3050 domain-containing protein [Polyangiales bacterium]
MSADAENRYRLRLARALAPRRERLTAHRVYRQLDTLPALRTFMQAHVFAVWDFMSLVKTLQRRVTCVDVPWFAPPDPISARILNEIVLVEESDVTDDGRRGSHFDLYLEAMREVGADLQPIAAFLDALRSGVPPTEALGRARLHPHTAAFVENTLATARATTHEVAASFLLGREAIIPAMFEQILAAARPLQAPMLAWYLRRHITVDGDEHGPAGWTLLSQLCGSDVQRWAAAAHSARRALSFRARLWDGVCQQLTAAG